MKDYTSFVYILYTFFKQFDFYNDPIYKIYFNSEYKICKKEIHFDI